MSLSLNLNALLDSPCAPREEIWGPGVAQGNLIQIYGPRGISKTRFCMGLGWAMASQAKFLKWFPAKKRVLYIDGELGRSSLATRLRETMAAFGNDTVSDYFRVLPYDSMGSRPWNLSDRRDQGRYEKEITDARADVVFLDNLLTLSRSESSRDSDFLQWERTQPWLAELRNRGLTVIFVHHTGKSGSQLGTSTKEVVLDAVIALRRPNSYRNDRNEFELQFEKHRDFEPKDTPPLHVEYIKGDDGISRWFWRPLGDDIDERIKTLRASGLTRAQIAKELGLSFGRVSQVVPRETKQGGMW